MFFGDRRPARERERKWTYTALALPRFSSWSTVRGVQRHLYGAGGPLASRTGKNEINESSILAASVALRRRSNFTYRQMGLVDHPLSCKSRLRLHRISQSRTLLRTGCVDFGHDARNASTGELSDKRKQKGSHVPCKKTVLMVEMTPSGSQ
jgi:hypothetical protein